MKDTLALPAMAELKLFSISCICVVAFFFGSMSWISVYAGLWRIHELVPSQRRIRQPHLLVAYEGADEAFVTLLWSKWSTNTPSGRCGSQTGTQLQLLEAMFILSRPTVYERFWLYEKVLLAIMPNLWLQNRTQWASRCHHGDSAHNLKCCPCLGVKIYMITYLMYSDWSLAGFPLKYIPNSYRIFRKRKGAFMCVSIHYCYVNIRSKFIKQ